MAKQENSKIGLWTATSIVLGNMIASAIFMLPAVLSKYGSISLIGWLVSGIGALCLALGFSWLSRIYPASSGGPYIYTRHEMGDFAAFLVAWGYWISIWSTNAAIAVAFVSYLSVFIPLLATNTLAALAVGLGAVWFLTWVNARGVKEGGRVQLISTILKIIPLVVITIGGLMYLKSENFGAFNTSGDSHMGAITATATLTLFAFLGLECATVPAGEIHEPEKTVPAATMYGTLAAMLIYFLSTVAVMGIVPPEVLRHSSAPFADAAEVLWGPWMRYLVGAGAVVSTFGALNGWMLMQAQIPAAAALDNAMPKQFGRLNQKGVPLFGLIVSSMLISVLLGLNFSKSTADAYEFILLLSTMCSLVAYLFSMAAHGIYLLRTHQAGKVPWVRFAVTLLAFGFGLWAVGGSGRDSVFWGFILLMLGVPVFAYLKGKGNAQRS